MKALGIETSTPIGSIAIVNEKNIIASSIFSSNVLNYGEWLGLEIKHLLSISNTSISDIGLIAVSSGPGSFSGLRTGMAFGYGISKGLNIPVVSVATLDGLSFHFIEDERQVCPIIDAKRKRIYTALYKKKRKISDYITCTIDDLFPLIREETIFLGDGALLYKDLIREGLGNLAHFALSFKNIPLSINIAFLGVEYFKKGKINDGCIYP
ncbi:MAG: tRNA (adenosine(37)-N6)-threonylcarbamoyltransferase complex dimerization subunit type 1 TsaB [bacterium]